MTTAAEFRAGLAEISNTIGMVVTASKDAPDPYSALVAHLDQVRGFIDQMSTTVTSEPDPDARVQGPRPGMLWCASCIQQARDAEAAGRMPLPINPAATIAQGMAICDVEGRHRIVTAVQHAVAQSSRLLLPGQGGPMPGGTVS